MGAFICWPREPGGPTATLSTNATGLPHVASLQGVEELPPLAPQDPSHTFGLLEAVDMLGAWGKKVGAVALGFKTRACASTPSAAPVLLRLHPFGTRCPSTIHWNPRTHVHTLICSCTHADTYMHGEVTYAHTHKH